jgi:osmotically-inducible protein OsmY
MKRFTLGSTMCSALLALSVSGWAQSTPVAPDNTGVNVRDRNAAALTADQQSNSNADIELTRKIRRRLENDPSLSVIAHNVKIISADGNVTLRGPVNTEREKASIGSKAQEVAGAEHKIDNQLEVRNQ